jgi:predicted SAM-dependent methyltransferase
MKLYIGSREFKPEGFSRVDIDPRYQPDILADAAELTPVASGSVDEVIASALLEHIPWPRSYQALSEWARVLKPGGILRLSVPDMRLLCSMVARGVNVYHCIGMMYGTGRIDNVFEAHQYGYTREMLVEMLTVLGFSDFGQWNAEVPDASNGWVWSDSGERLGLSLNLSATKVREPAVDTAKLVALIRENNLEPFMSLVHRVASNGPMPPADREVDTLLYQKLQMKLVDANQRIKHLEEERERLLAEADRRSLGKLRDRIRRFAPWI